MANRPKQTLHQRRHMDDQEEIENMLNIVNYQRNANQNYNEVTPHTCQNGLHQKIYKKIKVRNGAKKRDPSCTVGENIN